MLKFEANFKLIFYHFCLKSLRFGSANGIEMVSRQDNPESHEWIIIMTSPVAPGASGQ